MRLRLCRGLALEERKPGTGVADVDGRPHLTRCGLEEELLQHASGDVVAVPEALDLWPVELVKALKLPLVVGAQGRDFFELGLGKQPLRAVNEDGDLLVGTYIMT